MTDGLKALEKLKQLRQRADQDENFANVLKAVEEIIDREMDTDETVENPRSRLPYASDPPSCEAAWN